MLPVVDEEAPVRPVAEAPERRSAGRRSAILLVLAGAGLALLAGSRTWAHLGVSSNLPGLTGLVVTGRRAAPAEIPIALAAAAGAIVLATWGRVVRAVVGVGLVAAGVVVTFGAVRVIRSPDDAAAGAVRDALGVFSRGSGDGLDALNTLFAGSGFSVDVTLWPRVAALGGLLIAVAGLLTLATGWSWPGPTRRYDRPARTGAVPLQTPARTADDNPADLGSAGAWDALSRGEDPTSTDRDRT